MKNLLTMLAVSTFVGTSASNLKPMFTSNVSQGFKSNQAINKDLSITNENNTNPFYPKQLPSLNEQGIGAFAVDSSNNVYAGTTDGLYKSTDGINFDKINDKLNASVNDIAIQNTTIYASTNNDGLWKSSDGINFDKINEQNYINSLAVDFSGNIYAGTTTYGLLKSTNGGNSFSRIDNNIKMDFINKIIFDNYNNIWVACDNGLYKSTDGISFEQVKGIPNTFSISSIVITIDGKIYASTTDGLWKSSDGINFDKIYTINNSIITGILITKTKIIYISTNGDGLWKSSDGINFDKINESPNNIMFNSLVVTSNNVVYIGTYKGNGGIWTINLIEQLIKINKPDTFSNSWPKYKGIVYNSAQKIDIKENLVAKAKLDNKNITIPTTDLDLTNGEHTLVLTLKEEYKDSAVLFGGDNNTGEITYKLWVKTSIDKKDINYSTNTDDTDLTDLSLGFVSTTGNTINCPIIQTKSKDGSVHHAPLNISINDALIDYSNSYYVQGTVYESTNDFSPTGSKQKLQVNTKITTDGTYHLHLVDMVGNSYDSYLELGASNWKLHGTFDDSELNQLKNELNVTVNLTDPKQLSLATGWLTKYEQIVNGSFEKSLQANGKGFDSEIQNQITSYAAFLNPLTYEPNNEPKFDDGIDKDKLDKTISEQANELLNAGLDVLPQNLNVNTTNVVNKSTLDNYADWITNYQAFINKNKDQWIADITNIASRGFATEEQKNLIKEQVSKFLDQDNIKNYLKSVEWTPNLTASGYDDKYLQYVELDKLQSDAINWVSQNIPEINQTYQQALKTAESGLNLHGYSIEKLLNHKSIPQTKSAIDNFADGQSFHNWLQSQANIKFHGWQLAMGLGIAIPLFLVVAAIAWVIRSRTNPKYNGVTRAKKNLIQEKKQMNKNGRRKTKISWWQKK